MMLIYIIAPHRSNGISDEEENINNASDLAARVIEISKDGQGFPHAMPVCTPTMTWTFSWVTDNDEYWLEGTAEILRRCDAAFVSDDWQNSLGGCQAEIDLAELELGIPVLYSEEQLAEFLESNA